ncbi:MAG: hypothetical protein FGM24_05415 [Candidatus Kapabacteria bacterium]|nr:hypothetical protein [Candidatus Kapabacteria bacterium]
MKRLFQTLTLVAMVVGIVASATAQSIQYWRPYDKSGLNMFETPKDSGAAFTGQALRIGGGFAQGMQILSHENYVTDADGNIIASAAATKADTGNALYKMGAGFNNASANLNIDAQFARGVRLNLTMYLSARHHNETWVKGGYIQFDDLSFLGIDALNSVMQYLTIRLGHMEINYGDAHFRRSDGGSTLYNPFMENYLVDAFTTEIGGDITFQHNGIIAVLGATNGEIKGNIVPLADTLDKALALLGKVGWDGKIGDDGRIRVTGSFYTQSQSPRNTLFAGDRTGSNYYMVMEKQYATWTGDPKTSTSSSTTAQFTSGRINPNFANNVTSLTFNAFAQFGGLEFFGNYDMVEGANSPAEKASALGNRKMSQIAADLLYRFGSSKNFYVGARYNMVTLEEGGLNADRSAYLETSVDRIAVAAGWFLLDQIFLKAEYMMQNYNDFAVGNFRNGGKISGLTLQAVVGF